MGQGESQNAGNAAKWCPVPLVEPDPIPGLRVEYRLPQEAQYWGGVSSGECLIPAEQYSRPYRHTAAGPDPTYPELPEKATFTAYKYI
jgi:hypothetical protein